MPDAPKVSDGCRQIELERVRPFEKIIEGNNRQLADEIAPAYRKMAELFTSKMQFHENRMVVRPACRTAVKPMAHGL